MKVLLFGKQGQVGWELQRTLQVSGEVVALDSSQADLTDTDKLREVIRHTRPDVVINAAAYTAVDRAEEEQELAYAVNATAPGVIAEECAVCGALLIHYSTDYVYDGSKTDAYIEADQVSPSNVYGQSKLDGELAVDRSGCDHIILRTSWVYASRGSNFLLTMIGLMRSKDTLSVVDDQVGAPTCARHIADTTAVVVQQTLRERVRGEFTSDVYHLAASGQASWYDFAVEIERLARELLDDSALAVQRIDRISTADYPFIAKRPVSSRLCTDKIETRFSIVMPDWRESVALTMAELG